MSAEPPSPLSRPPADAAEQQAALRRAAEDAGRAISIFERIAREADLAEAACREEFARRIAEVERNRSFAYRRLNLVREMAGFAAAVEMSDAAEGAALAAVRRELGWDDDTPVRAEILRRLEPVAAALVMLTHPEPLDGTPAPAETPGDAPPSLPDALAAFEAWHEERFGASFWSLFDVYVQERPVVDF